MSIRGSQKRVRRKLIEVAIPLDEINVESAREKHLSAGHPSTMHTWWARRPLATCRSVIFACLVDDPSDCEEFDSETRELERQELFNLMSELSAWEKVDQNTKGGDKVVNRARAKIAESLARSRGERAPTDPGEIATYLSDARDGITVYDPFAGGGSIPLEAQRLGLSAAASDLNPVAVLINKMMIEKPIRHQNRDPISEKVSCHNSPNLKKDSWSGYTGVARDIRYYGEWMRAEALNRIGGLYPKVALGDGTEATVAAWIWVNTVPCPNPACGIRMPLTKSLILSKKKGRQRFARPIVDRQRKAIRFEVEGVSPDFCDVETVSSRGAKCLACGQFVPLTYVRDQSLGGALDEQLIAIAAQARRGKVILPTNPQHEDAATRASPNRRPPGELQQKPLGVSVQLYGFERWNQLFTNRQLLALNTFADLLVDCERKIIEDGAEEDYADLLRTYLAFAFAKFAQTGCRLARWRNDSDRIAGLFARPTIGMVWNFGEANPFSKSPGNWSDQVNLIADAVSRLPLNVATGSAFQADAAKSSDFDSTPVVITDPPYYNNIGFADLADFFYVWHKDLLGSVYPDLFLGTLSPKLDELIVGPLFEDAEDRFERLMADALSAIRKSCASEFPSAIYYAYKQKITEGGGVVSTAWDRFLSALLSAGFQIVATWPMRTEGRSRLTTLSRNSLSTSIVIVVRPRDSNATVSSKRRFISQLESDLPNEIRGLTERGIGPIDLAQAAIGPGMKIFSKYTRVESMAGEPMSVREALNEINRVLDDFYRGEEANLDSGSRFCRSWLDQHDFDAGPYGDAEALALARDVSINDLRDNARLVDARAGTMRLLTSEEITLDLTREEPSADTTAWEGCMQVVYHMKDGEGRRGIDGAAEVVAAIGSEKADQVKSLAGILFNHYDRKFEPRNSRVYNDIVNQWPEIMAEAGDESRTQTRLAAA